MDNRSQPAGVGAQFGAVDVNRQSEPGQTTARHSAAPASSKEPRPADVALETDGQIVEAGYGHGV